MYRIKHAFGHLILFLSLTTLPVFAENTGDTNADRRGDPASEQPCCDGRGQVAERRSERRSWSRRDWGGHGWNDSSYFYDGYYPYYYTPYGGKNYNAPNYNEGYYSPYYYPYYGGGSNVYFNW